MSKSSLEAAAEAAAKVNAMLIAKGKLKLSPSQIKPKIGNNSIQGRAKTAGDLITAEIDINDAPLSARNLLTRGHLQDEICKSSGASISTRGRYMTPEERQNIATPECRPLYLNVQASSLDAIKVAVKKIQEIIDYHIQLSGLPKSSTVGVVTYPATCLNGALGPSAVAPTTHIPTGTHFVQDKVFVGLEQTPADYPVREKILGPGGCFLQHIRTETGATVTLRGKGSGFIEPTSGREAFEPLYIHITHPKPEGLQAAKALAVNLVETAHVEFAQWQQAQQAVLQPLAPVVLPQAAAYQSQMLVTPPVLPTGTGMVTPTLQIATTVPAGGALSAAIPSMVHVSVPNLMSPVSVVSSVQGMASPTVITYPTLMANTSPVVPRPPTVSLISVVPTMPAATTYTTAQVRPPFQNPVVLTTPLGYANITPPQANVTQPIMASSPLVASVADTINYPVAARFTVPPPSLHSVSDAAKQRYYNGIQVSAANEFSRLQESNVNHPTEAAWSGGCKRTHGDRDLMPPPPPTSVSSATLASKDKKWKMEPSRADQESEEPERKKLKGALVGLASMYGSDDSETEDD